MLKTREQKAKMNMFTSLLSQIVTIICGLIIPRVMINHFGSEVYGATASISQFLSYITLLEGGIGGVARAALYKPLAENNSDGISGVYFAIKKFFNIVAVAFVVYTIVIGFIYKDIADVTFLDRTFTFFLVLVISLSTLAQYFFGVANLTLLNADQKQYIGYVANIATIFINALMVVILINLNCNILVVKLVSSLIFIIKPLVFSFYVKKHYNIDKKHTANKTALEQKWSGLGQHLAFFLHSNTDVVVLTLFANLKAVSVYSVYSMVSTSIKSIVSSFTGGMEAVYGNMIAKKEYDNLKRTFGYYETLISFASSIFFATAISLVVPFVKLYTSGVKDADYIQPVFAIVLISAEFLFCLRMPYASFVVAGNRFKQTQVAAYGEAIINVLLSCILVLKFGLVGVAIGTFVGTLFRFVYYIVYLNKHLLYMSIFFFLKRIFVGVSALLLDVLLSNLVLNLFTINDFYIWIICGFISFGLSSVVSLAWFAIWNKKDLMAIMGKLSHKK